MSDDNIFGAMLLGYYALHCVALLDNGNAIISEPSNGNVAVWDNRLLVTDSFEPSYS